MRCCGSQRPREPAGTATCDRLLTGQKLIGVPQSLNDACFNTRTSDNSYSHGTTALSRASADGARKSGASHSTEGLLPNDTPPTSPPRCRRRAASSTHWAPQSDSSQVRELLQPSASSSLRHLNPRETRADAPAAQDPPARAGNGQRKCHGTASPCGAAHQGHWSCHGCDPVISSDESLEDTRKHACGCRTCRSRSRSCSRGRLRSSSSSCRRACHNHGHPSRRADSVDNPYAIYDKNRYADRPSTTEDRRSSVDDGPRTDFWRQTQTAKRMAAHNQSASVCSSSAAASATVVDTSACMTSSSMVADSSASTDSSLTLDVPTARYLDTPRVVHAPRKQSRPPSSAPPVTNKADPQPLARSHSGKSSECKETQRDAAPLKQPNRVRSPRKEDADRKAEKRTSSEVSKKQSFDPSRREETLRKEFASLCTCYWKTFPELPMPINPASHAPSCPAHTMQEKYEAFVRREAGSASSASQTSASDLDEDDGEHDSSEKRAAASSTESCSRCGCFDCCCACCRGGHRVTTETHACCARCAAERLSRRQRRARASSVRNNPQRQQQTAGGSRSAVMGTAKRRTVFDVLTERQAAALAASSTAPNPPKTSDASDPKIGTEENSPEATASGRKHSPLHETRTKAGLAFVVPPGPGAYDVATAYARTSATTQARQTTIGKAVRPTDRKDPKADLPGPGDYNLAPPLVPIAGARKAEGGEKEGNATDTHAPGEAPYKPPPQAPAPFYSSSARALTYGVASPHLKRPLPTEKERDGERLVSTSPGPGAYRPEDAFPQEARAARPPAFGFPKAPAAASGVAAVNPPVPVVFGLKQRDTSPGPGAYDARTGTELGAPGSSPAAVIPHAAEGASGHRRTTLSPNANVNLHNGSDTAVYGDVGTGTSVGPGSYAAEEAWTYTHGGSYAATFGHSPRRLDDVHSLEVGPGDYDADAAALALKFPQSPQWSMRGTRHPGRSLTDAVAETSLLPGPGEYMPLYSTQQPALPGYYFGTAPRLPSSPQDTATNTEGAANGAVGVAVAEGFHSDAWHNVPGAGWVTAAPRVTHFAELAHRSAASGAPGPGAYAVTYDPVEPRAPTALLNGTAPRDAGGAHTGGAFVTSERGFIPGPGTYEVEATLAALEHRTGAVIGSAPRRVGVLAAGMDLDTNAGPGSYELPRPDVGPVYSFPRGAKAVNDGVGGGRVDLEVPGPGLYNLGEALDASSAQRRVPSAILATTGPRFTPSSGNEEEEKDQFPGPGAYSPDNTVHTARIPAPVFGTAPRLLVDEAEQRKREEFRNLGPGSYEPQDEPTAGGARFAQAPRFDEEVFTAGDGGALPGPGAYETGSYYRYMDGRQESYGVGGSVAVAGTAPRQTEAARAAEGRMDVPGPGAYMPQLSAVQRAPHNITFGSAPREGLSGKDAHENANIGPGSYDVSRLASSPCPPRVVFGSAPRVTTAQEAAATAEATGNMGPGTYSPHELHSMGAGARAAVFGSAPRDAAADGRKHDEGIPGPGTYEVYVGKDGRLLWRDVKGPVTFATGPARSTVGHEADANPGPGSYLPLVDRDSIAGGVGRRGVVFGTGPGHPLIEATDSNGEEGGGTSSMVGPGAYDVRDTLRHPQAPSYSFGKPSNLAGHEGEGGEPTPGPGAYLPVVGYGASSVVLPAHKAVSFGTSARFPEEASSAGADGLSPHGDGHGVSLEPGPGFYSPTYQLVEERPPAVHMGTSQRQPASDDAARLDSDGRSLYPGPGTYAPAVTSKSKTEGPSVVFPTAPRFPAESTSASHDPSGASGDCYDVARAQHAVLPSAPAFSFGKAGVALCADGSVQGTMGAAGTAATEATPGPGYYEITREGTMRLIYPTAPVVRFGTGPRDARTEEGGDGQGSGKGNATPGPGSYAMPRTFPQGPQVTFGTAPTGRARTNEEVGDQDPQPGPGSYTVVLPQDGPAFSFGTARTAFGESTSAAAVSAAGPGPGDYDAHHHTTVGRGGPAISVPRASRFPAPEGDGGDGAEAAIGPGAYDISLASGPAISFPRAPRESPDDTHARDLPGPGHYTLPSLHESAAKGPDGGVALRYTAGRFPTSQDTAGTGTDVGPGAYAPEPASRHTRSGPSFPQAERFPTAAPEAATEGDPGLYDIPLALRAISGNGRAPVFGTAPRDPSVPADASDRPGPGSYNLGGVVGKDGPAFSMTARRPDGTTSEREELPGPGAYAVQHGGVGTDSRAAIMLGRHDAGEGTAASTVGPGAYDVANALRASQKASPAYTMTGKPDDRRHASSSSHGDHPGPGAYDSTRALDYLHGTGPAFSLTGLPRERQAGENEAGPGPGDYSVPPFSSHVPAVSFGTSPRMVGPLGTASASDTTGPGMYDVTLPASGPAYSFGNAPRLTPAGEGDGGIGPGAYDTNASLGQPSILKGSPAISFPKAPRMSVTHDETAGPGPGAYSLPGRADHTEWFRGKLGPSLGIGSGVADRDGYMPYVDMDIPGPGSYDPYPAAGSGPAPSFGFGDRWSMDAHREGQTQPDVGPGAYYSPYGDVGYPGGCGVARAPSLGIGARPDPVPPHARDTPGPGEYYRPDVHRGGVGASFGIGARPPLRPVSETPGPGEYHRPDYSMGQGEKGVSFGIGERPPLMRNTSTPGPGTYFHHPVNGDGRHDAPRTPSFGIGERPPLAQPTDTPGPGSYYKTPTYDTDATGRGPSFGFGERPSPVTNDYPGPGEYFRGIPSTTGHPQHAQQPPSTLPGTSFGLGERTMSTAASATPAPNAYQPTYRWSEGADKPTIPKAERFPAPDSASTPGPATYQRDLSLGYTSKSGGVADREKERGRQVRFHLPMSTNPSDTVGSNGNDDAAVLARLAKAGYPVKGKP